MRKAAGIWGKMVPGWKRRRHRIVHRSGMAFCFLLAGIWSHQLGEKLHLGKEEDNELNAEILTELLKIEGAECTICENGEEILKAFEQSAPGDYDMILMDVQMPVMNGYEATKAIRRSSHKLAKTIPIIAMTANAFSEDIQHSLAAGMNAHVSKPVEMKVLEKTIRSIKSGGGVPNRRSLYSDEWKVTGHRRIKKDS